MDTAEVASEVDTAVGNQKARSNAGFFFMTQKMHLQRVRLLERTDVPYGDTVRLNIRPETRHCIARRRSAEQGRRAGPASVRLLDPMGWPV